MNRDEIEKRDAEAAQALVVERAAEVGADATIAYWREADKPVAERKHGGASMPSFVMKEILALAPSSGVAALAELRAERDALLSALNRIRELNMTAPDKQGKQWAESDLIEQEIALASAAGKEAR